MQFRYVPDLLEWNPTVLGAGQAFDGSDQARVAFHNDCFMSSDTDVGTYSEDAVLAARQRAYAMSLTEWTPFGGESCDAGAASGQRRSCAEILTEGREYHLAYLNVGYYKAFHDQWKAEGCYDEVSRTIGYRFQLDAVSHPPRAARGTTVPVRIDLRNLGWSRIFSARRLVVTLRHQGSGAEITGEPAGDLRQLAPTATASSRIDARVAIPAGAATGAYELLLAVPGIYPKTAADPRFAVRPANADAAAQGQAWDPLKARFASGTTLEIE